MIHVLFSPCNLHGCHPVSLINLYFTNSKSFCKFFPFLALIPVQAHLACWPIIYIPSRRSRAAIHRMTVLPVVWIRFWWLFFAGSAHPIKYGFYEFQCVFFHRLFTLTKLFLIPSKTLAHPILFFHVTPEVSAR